MFSTIAIGEVFSNFDELQFSWLNTEKLNLVYLIWTRRKIISKTNTAKHVKDRLNMRISTFRLSFANCLVSRVDSHRQLTIVLCCGLNMVMNSPWSYHVGYVFAIGMCCIEFHNDAKKHNDNDNPRWIFVKIETSFVWQKLLLNLCHMKDFTSVVLFRSLWADTTRYDWEVTGALLGDIAGISEAEKAEGNVDSAEDVDETDWTEIHQ